MSNFAVLDDDHGLAVAGELDLASEPLFRRALSRMAPGAQQLDLSEATFIDCHGARAVTEAVNDLGGRQRHVSVVAAASVRRLFELMRLEEMLGLES